MPELLLARPVRRPGRPLKGQEKINVGQALKLRLQNWTYHQIAKKFDVCYSAVVDALKPFADLVPDPAARIAYQANKAEVLEAVQLRLIASLIDSDKIAKASLNNTAYAASKIDEMLRLERGQSTKNINVLTALIDGMHKQLFVSKTASEEVEAAPILENNGLLDETIKDNQVDAS